MRKNKKYIAILALLLMFAVSCGKKKEQAKDDARPVKVQVLENNQMSLGYTASGTIKGIEETPYTATASGEVIVINAKNGDNVNAGQVIVSIDNQAARSGVTSAVSNVEMAESNIKSAQADIRTAQARIDSAAIAVEEARINFDKYRTLYEKRLITETDYLSAKSALSSAEANLRTMRNNYDSTVSALNNQRSSLSSARANLATANDTNNKSVIKTKGSGAIANMSLEKNQQVSVGDTLFTLVNESEMKLEVGVSPQVVEKIYVGSEARVKIDELKGEEIVGEVYEVSSSADSKTKQFTVKIKLKNDDRRIKSGMYGTATINTGAEAGLVIPKNAIVIRGVEQVVYVVRNGKAVAIPIQISNQNEKFAAVTGEGLTAGSELIVDGQNVIQADEKVKIVQ